MMRSGVVSLALASLVACGEKPATDQRRLPESVRGRRVDAAGWITIDLGADRSAGLNGKEVSLAGLRQGLAREYESTPIEMHHGSTSNGSCSCCFDDATGQVLHKGYVPR